MKNKSTIILAIESSCDDTSVAIIENGKVLSNVIATQNVHEQYGGVVPEMASRAHMQHIVPTTSMALQQAKISLDKISAIACTQSPGLMGSLIVGLNFGKAIAQSLKIPLITVHHMQAHILAHWAEEPYPSFPFLCLTVSGGHTQLVICNNHLEMEIVGNTLDDAAGEAFDKIAKMLQLPYPGGPLIDKYAKAGDPESITFPIPKISGLDFSFSGLKTSVLYFLQKTIKQTPNYIEANLNDICASVQATIVKILMNKLKKAAKQYQIKNVGIAGGVSANSKLRDTLEKIGNELDWNVFIPEFQYCTDNAAMIGITAYYKYLRKEFSPLTVAPMAKSIW